ncbi:MAG: hypothetical protein ACLQME_05075, partial [Alphaproteobacteria bacterium]
MNKLERTILRAAVTANRNYLKMTDGEWLNHGPEHFLLSEVARAIWRNQNFWVFVDTSGDNVADALVSGRKVLESGESVVIHCGAPESHQGGA